MKPPQHLPQTSQINENNQLQFIRSQHQLENHHFYQHHQHQREYPTTQTTINITLQDHQHSTVENQPLQDHQNSTMTDFTNNPFQDHHHHHLDTTHTQPFQDQRQLQLLPAATHSRTTYCKSTIPSPRILHKTIPTDHHYYHYQHLQDHTTRYWDTFHNKYIIYQYSTASATTLHHLKIEIRRQKDRSY